MNFLTALMLAVALLLLWRFVILGIFMALKTALRILNHSRQ